MNLGQAILEALESLASNKLRSGLTILGIVIGVGAVIAMLGVGQGAQDTITGSISGIGSNLLFVFSGNMQEDVRNEQPLTRNDANAIADPFQAPSVAAVAPVLQGNAEVTFGSERTGVSIYGVTPDYAPVRNYAVVEGEFINTEHLLGQASVALLGPDTAQKLFGRTDGVTGETIRINGQPFRVIGVLESKGGGSFGSQDDVILVPFDTAQARLIRRSRDRVDLIFVQVADPSLVNQAREEVAQILRTRHRTELGADDFTIFSQDDFVATAQTITGVLTIFLGGIAAISLLVGGIGIMNIMLSSVMERIREIGLRQAIGASRNDIIVQFLAESTLISVVGGFAGIILGITLSKIITAFFEIKTIVSLFSIVIAFGVSALVGITFGYLPAKRASDQDPVESLRQ